MTAGTKTRRFQGQGSVGAVTKVSVPMDKDMKRAVERAAIKSKITQSEFCRRAIAAALETE